MRKKMLVRFKTLPKNALERRQILRQTRRIKRKLKINASMCGKTDCELFYSNLKWPKDCDRICKECTCLNQRRVRHVDNGLEHKLTTKAIKRLQMDLCEDEDCFLREVTKLEHREINGIVDMEGIMVNYSPEQA